MTDKKFVRVPGSSRRYVVEGDTSGRTYSRRQVDKLRGVKKLSEAKREAATRSHRAYEALADDYKVKVLKKPDMKLGQVRKDKQFQQAIKELKEVAKKQRQVKKIESKKQMGFDLTKREKAKLAELREQIAREKAVALKRVGRLSPETNDNYYLNMLRDMYSVGK